MVIGSFTKQELIWGRTEKYLMYGLITGISKVHEAALFRRQSTLDIRGA
jgi:hypothetical protein